MENDYTLTMIHVPRHDQEPYWELDLETDLVKDGHAEFGDLPDPYADLAPGSRHMNWSECMTIMYSMNFGDDDDSTV